MSGSDKTPTGQKKYAGFGRAVLFDTETTGLSPVTGDRVIEIAALELMNDLPTGKYFHKLVNPERDVPPEATRVHGFTLNDLQDKPLFAEIAEEMMLFFGESRLIAHNAPFDFSFLNAELQKLGFPVLAKERMVDTLVMAKERFPGMPNNLDALCRRFEIDLSERTTHNALLDCKLLAEVYLELTGGRQRGLALPGRQAVSPILKKDFPTEHQHQKRLIQVSEEEKSVHRTFLKKLKDPLWAEFFSEEEAVSAEAPDEKR